MSGQRYSIILADPPWSFRAHAKTGAGRTAAAHYDTMTPEELRAMSPAIDRATTPRAALFLWVVPSNLVEGLDLLSAWGYRFTTIAFVWHKLGKAPVPEHDLGLAIRRAGLEAAHDGANLTTYAGQVYRTAFGMGHYTRTGAELCLLGLRGQMPVADHGVRQVIHAPIREHSRKPDEQYAFIERLYPGRQYLELFARQRWPGWATFGDETDKFTSEINS